MCCGRKKQKPASVPPKQNGLTQAVTVQQNFRPTNPKSKVSFLANDYNPQPMQHEQSFQSTKRPALFVQDNPDRRQDYAEEVRFSRQTKLLAPQELLNYNLDGVEGVSGNPTLDTFHYQSVLGHWFLHRSFGSNDVVPQRDTIVRQNVYEPSSEPFFPGQNTFGNNSGRYSQTVTYKNEPF